MPLFIVNLLYRHTKIYLEGKDLMKSIFKFCILGVTILSVTLSGCSASKVADKERNKIVAEVNGENILKGEVLDEYDAQKVNYNITAENEGAEENKELVASLKSSVLENLIYTKLIMQNASKAGFSVTDEILEQSKTEFNGILKSVEEQIKLQEGEDTSGNIDYAKKAQEFVDEQLKQMGKTQDEYIRLIAEQTVTQQFMDKTIGEVQVSDDEIKSFYDSEIKAQKEGTSTEELQLYSESGVRVKHILIQLPEEEQTEYNRLLSEQKTEEAQKYLEEKQKAINPKAQEVLTKVKNGEDFDKLIKEYGEDPGMVDNEEGYTVKQDGQFVPEFEEASLKLKVGQTSELVPTVFGYHIIKAYEVIDEKVFTLEEKREEIKQAINTQKEDEKWGSFLEEWKGKATIKTYEELL
jgi:parvulin-like peptidyl-prolyl isomerase